MIVIAEGFVPNDYIFEMAKAMGVTLISTPYNLMKIIQMIYRSIPVRMIMTPKEKAVAFHPSEYLEGRREEDAADEAFFLSRCCRKPVSSVR